MQFTRFFSSALLSACMLISLVGCGNGSASDQEQDTTKAAAVDTAAVDQAVRDYFANVDSLAAVFNGLSAVDDVVERQGEIRHLSTALNDFNAMAAQTGMLMQERMDALGTSQAVQTLIDARRRLDSLEGVALAVNAIENGKELSHEGEANAENK